MNLSGFNNCIPVLQLTIKKDNQVEMNIIEFLDTAPTAEGEFVLPSGEKVRGKFFRKDSNHTLFLHVTPPGSQWSHPPDELQVRTSFHGIVCGKHLTVVGSVPRRTKTVPAGPYYEVSCQRLLSAHTHQVPDDYSVARVKFNITSSRDIFEKSIGISYPFGEREILSCDTSFGRITVDVIKTAPPYEDKFNFNLVPFPDRADIFHVEQAIEYVLRFIWLITGTRQYAENIQLTVRDDVGEFHNLDANFLLQEPPILSEEFVPTPCHAILIDSYTQREEFERCLTAWSNLSFQKRIACDEMLSQFNEPNHSPFRMSRHICAYEWWYHSQKSAQEGIDEYSVNLIKEIVNDVKQYVKGKYGKTPERDRVLSLIGNIPSQKKRTKSIQKVLSRLEIIQEHLPGKMSLDRMKFLLDKAVDCRNNYTHESAIINAGGISTICRYIYANTLEFVFLCSVLVECGWDMKSRIVDRESSTRSKDRTGDRLIRPFDSYILNFEEYYEICSNGPINKENII